MRYVNRLGVACPAVLTDDDANAARREIADFLGRDAKDLGSRRAPLREDLYRHPDVLDALHDLFDRRCAYCEEGVLDFEPDKVMEDVSFVAVDAVDHHRPPSNAANIGRAPEVHHYAWLAYEWPNLLLVCRACRSRKRHYFPVKGRRAPLMATLDEVRAQESPHLLDPTLDAPHRHLDFTLGGLCHPRSRRGAATIDLLELNRDELVRSRGQYFTLAASNVAEARNLGEMLGVLLDLGNARSFPGAHLILRNRFAQRLSKHRGLFTFAFDDTAGVLPRLCEGAELSLLKDIFEQLAQPLERQAARVNFASAPPPAHWTPYANPIRRVEVENFKGLQQLAFDLPMSRPGSSSQAASLMLLGENSTGKSTLLEAVSLTLAGADNANGLGLNPMDFIRRADPGAWRMIAPAPARVKIEFWEGPPAELVVPITGDRFDGTPQPSANVRAYGARRFFRGNRRRQAGVDIRGLFDPLWVLPHPGQWLGGLKQAQFEAAARALREVLALHDEDDLIRDAEGRVFVVAHGQTIPIERLSEGYKSLFATAVDIMRGVLGPNGDLETSPGVVLIDEIEVHLHPRWKLRVMTALRKAMPRVQFIVTTHDPLCLRGMYDKEVQVLVRDAKQNIDALEDLPDVRGLRAEQLLTSDFFGLASTADPDVEIAMARRADQIQSGAAPAVSPILQAMPLGETLGEQLAVEAMTQFLDSQGKGSGAERQAARKGAVQALRAALEAGGAAQ